MTLRYALATDTGRERDNNEDSARVVEELGLFVVADGMGGHVGGEVASKIAVDTFTAFIQSHDDAKSARDEIRVLSEALLEANSAVQHEAKSKNLLGMGTTFTAARIRGRTATICHVGDSRAYLLQDGELRSLTQDHTIVWLLVEEGVISPEEAKDHPERHMLTQALGTQELIEPDIVREEIPAAARLLLCSDGLHDTVPAQEIAELASGPKLEAAAQALVDRANAHGGPDNITLILIEP